MPVHCCPRVVLGSEQNTRGGRPGHAGRWLLRGSDLRKLQAHLMSLEAFSSFIRTVNYAPKSFFFFSLMIGPWLLLVEIQKLSQDGVDFEPKQIIVLVYSSMVV